MEEKQVRRSSNKDRKDAILAKLAEWQAAGCTPQEAAERLTPAQWDFMVDQGIDLDALVLTPEQLKNRGKTEKRERRKSPEGYNKKYPEEKKHLYDCFRILVEGMGAEIIPREKPNYRDLDFVLDGKHYKVVLSEPRS